MNRKVRDILFFTFIILVTLILIIVINNINKPINYKYNTVKVQVDAYVIKSDNEDLSSGRDKENVEELFAQVNRIWKQADIIVEVVSINEVNVNKVSAFTRPEYMVAHLLDNNHYNKDRINAYFVKSLGDNNGIALPGNIIMVADRTSVFDFRATSHEIGHVLGLSHVAPTNRLLARGVNGFDLVQYEINTARNNALNFKD